MVAIADLTRPDFGGSDNLLDLHIEEHLGLVDSSFMYTSRFASLADIRTLRGTNQLRLDRLGKANVAGRKSGEDLALSKIRQEQWNMSVDTTIYIRNAFDQFDDWISNLDARREYGKLHGIELAKTFDQACLIQAAKCADFVVPTGLEGAFFPGILVPVTITSAVADGEANAAALVAAHRKSLEALELRDLGDQLYSEGVTFVDPQIFSVLLEHKKLLNVEYQQVGNDFAKAKIGMLNGVRITSTPRVPTSAITSHPLGDAFTATAAEARRRMITILPSRSLVVAQVAGLTADYWEEKKDFTWYLQTYQAYNIGQRRPDSVAVVDVTIS